MYGSISAKIAFGWTEAESAIACVASVSVWFRRKERGTRDKDRAKNGARGEGVGKTFPSFPSPTPLFHFLALVSFLAQPKPKIPLLGLSLLRKLPETHATQPKSAKKNFADSKISGYVWTVPKIVLTDNIQSGGNCSVYYYY